MSGRWLPTGIRSMIPGSRTVSFARGMTGSVTGEAEAMVALSLVTVSKFLVDKHLELLQVSKLLKGKEIKLK